MRTLEIVNIEKFNNGYLERKNPWFKVSKSGILTDFNFVNLCEIDKWRFIHFLGLQIEQKKPVPLDLEWLTFRGMDFKTRRLESTLRQLKKVNLIEINGRTPLGTEGGTALGTELGTEGEQSREQRGNRAGNRGGTEQGTEQGTEGEQESQDGNSKGDTTTSILRTEQNRTDKNRIEKAKYVKDDPPNLGQIKDYISQKGYNVDGQYFLDVYENANPPWSNKKGELMRSWKGTLATWNKNSEPKKKERKVQY